MDKPTILVNGMLYDAITGMPIKKQTDSRASTAPEKRRSRSSHQVHKKADVSRAVRRKEPEAKQQILKRTLRAAAPASSKSHLVTKFAPKASVAQKHPRTMNDIRPSAPHPIARKAHERMVDHAKAARPHTAVVKPSSVIKKEAIHDALSKSTAHHSAGKHIKTKQKKGIMRFAPVGLSLLLLTGYLTYVNLPNISVRVAASQAGIDARYPGYRPDGYRLSGVNYDTGSVSLTFAANAGPHNFTITQQQTNWDSTAVKENYVKSEWGDDVVPYSERGLTIYAHEGNAAWVNGGILYTITGDATLSTTQVRSIATSL